MKTWSITDSKILLRSLIIIVLIFTGTFIFIDRIVYQKMKSDVVDKIILTTEMANLQIEDIFTNTKIITDQISTNMELKDYVREVSVRGDITANPLYPRVMSTLKDITALNNNIYLAWVSNEKANFCLDSNGVITDASFLAKIRPWYLPAVESTEPSFSLPYYEYTTNTLAISCIKAIRENNQIIGFVSADISLETLPKAMENFSIGKNGRKILLTNTGTVVFACNDPENKTLISVSDIMPHIKELKNGNKAYTEITLNNHEYFLTYHVFEINQWSIIQLIDKAEVMSPFQKTMNLILYAFLFSCLISVGILGFNIHEQGRIQFKLKNEAVTDFLTGIYNRKYFFERSEAVFKIAKENSQNLSMFMIDIDDFKNVNDKYGHSIGDLVLKSAAEELAKVTRKDDILCRFGGDEFALLLINTDQEMATLIANRILQSISQLQIPTENGPVSFSVSIGLALMQKEDTDIENLMKRADDALYRAKNTNRGQLAY